MSDPRRRLAEITAQLSERVPDAIGDYAELLARGRAALAAVERAEEAYREFMKRMNPEMMALLEEFDELHQQLGGSQ